MNVTKRFGKVLALDRVTFDVEDGEYLCVLGPTGSGKTTLLRLIAGLLKPEEGTIYFDDKPVTNIDPQDRNSVFVPQQYALFPHLTVLQNVAFGPLAKGSQEAEALETAKKTLDLVRLAGRSDAFPSELSGGMQQRVALARGLASGAKLLLLDEPLGAKAQSLGYKLDATAVDAKKYPKYQGDQRCANCQFFKAGPGVDWGPCQVFSLRQVSAKGWCISYFKKA